MRNSWLNTVIVAAVVTTVAFFFGRGTVSVPLVPKPVVRDYHFAIMTKDDRYKIIGGLTTDECFDLREVANFILPNVPKPQPKVDAKPTPPPPSTGSVVNNYYNGWYGQPVYYGSGTSRSSMTVSGLWPITTSAPTASVEYEEKFKMLSCFQ